MSTYGIERKVFISFHQKDRSEVDSFIELFANSAGIFIPKALGVSDNDDFINWTSPGFVDSQGLPEVAASKSQGLTLPRWL